MMNLFARKKPADGTESVAPVVEETMAARAYRVAQAAVDEDRELSRGEFDLVRGATQDPNTPTAIRGALQALGDDLDRQTAARRERKRVADEQERARQHKQKLEERQAAWEALDPATAAVLNALADRPQDASLLALLKHLQRPGRGPVPATFMPELVPAAFRLPGFGG